ncbi:hypothetical protein C491_13567 [Natronococcus amylolyticus DSM 10524]|uniref:Uncharacterized protein n=1 Tax=Natronococcus amylolyticus DSM 10524 TaxID=1227497 RepID=L9X5X1_9EURY|nr:hypothetical protein C491_13567 [Natronococcus amylolyticus DSM 10524]
MELINNEFWFGVLVSGKKPITNVLANTCVPHTVLWTVPFRWRIMAATRLAHCDRAYSFVACSSFYRPNVIYFDASYRNGCMAQ